LSYYTVCYGTLSEFILTLNKGEKT